MDLYLIRHADAVPGGPELPDPQRPLSPEGRKKMKGNARGLAKLLAAEVTPFLTVLSSPLKRALETATILAREVNGEEQVKLCPPLGAEFSWADLLPFLADCDPQRGVALVGHEPTLGQLAGWLVAPGSKAVIPLRKGSVARFELEEAVEAPEARLVWLLTGGQLRMLR